MHRSCSRRVPSAVPSVRRQAWMLVLLLLFLALAPGAPRAATVSDPLEPLNRGIFEFNRVVDRFVLRPVTDAYVLTVPEPGRRGVTNFLENLRSPVIFVNHLLQGEREQAGVTFGRFFINSTMGIFGIFDFASMVGMEPRQDADFGQTLGTYGVGGGIYIVLPLFGPSTLRDAGGRIVDAFVLDPLPYVADQELLWARQGVGAVDTRYRYGDLLDDLEAQSLDFYIAARSAFLQNRAARIRKGSGERDDAYESIFEEELDID